MQGQGYIGKYLELRGGEGTVGWVKLHNEEFHFLCFMAYNVGGGGGKKKSWGRGGGVGLAGGEKKIFPVFWLETLKEGDT